MDGPVTYPHCTSIIGGSDLRECSMATPNNPPDQTDLTQLDRAKRHHYLKIAAMVLVVALVGIGAWFGNRLRTAPVPVVPN